MVVKFDPGFAQYTAILSVNIEYVYSVISKFKNLGQRKNQFKMYYQKILKLVDNNVAFCLGCMLWAVYIKSFDNEEIINNPCLGSEYNEAEAVEEIEFSKNYFEQLKRDTKYYLGQDYIVKPEYLRVLEVYKEFLTLNRGFVNTKTTSDLKLPTCLKCVEDVSAINTKIEEVLKAGDLPELFELYGIIL